MVFTLLRNLNVIYLTYIVAFHSSPEFFLIVDETLTQSQVRNTGHPYVNWRLRGR